MYVMFVVQGGRIAKQGTNGVIRRNSDGGRGGGVRPMQERKKGGKVGAMKRVAEDDDEG